MDRPFNRARPPVAKEGWPFILAPLALAFLLAVLGWAIAALVLFGLACFVTYFFRDPERIFTPREGGVVCPADGKVVFVDQVAAAPLSGRPALKIAIFMNVFDVHVNRSPVAGKVTGVKYVPGKFLNASLDKASEFNERLHLALETESGEGVEVVQIAGLIARRIVCFARLGDELSAGERFGLIRFGSRVDIYLPPEARPLVTIGQRVAAGQSIIGTMPVQGRIP